MFHKSSNNLKVAALILSKYTWIFLLVFYTLLITTLQPFLLSLYDINSDLFDSYSFTFSRGLKYLAYLAFSVYFAIIVSQDKRSFDLVLVSLASGLCAAEIVGLLQQTVFLVSGIDILPITRTGFSSDSVFHYLSVTVNFVGLNFLRINSISHEPKGLAGLISILVILKFYWSYYMNSQSVRSRYISLLNRYMSKTLWVSLLVLFLTFSGSAILILLPFFMIFFSNKVSDMATLRSKEYLYILFVFACFSLVFMADNVLAYLDAFLDASLYRRLGGFFEFKSFDALLSSLDPEDGAFLYNLIRYPFVFSHGLGFGSYSNLSFDFVKAAYSKYNDVVFVSPFSRNIFIELFFSSGAIGLFLLSCFVKKHLLRRDLLREKTIYTPLLLLLVIGFSIRSNEFLFFVFLSLVLSCSSFWLYPHPLRKARVYRISS